MFLDNNIKVEDTRVGLTKEYKVNNTQQIDHQDINYNNQKYTVCYILYNKQPKLFVIDFEDKNKVIYLNWHFQKDGSYLTHTYYENQKNKKLSLHNLIMDKLTHLGRGQQSTIDHINRIGTDNRKCNLRLVESQSEQNFNQQQKSRNIVLPENCGIDVKDIPKNINYNKASKTHGAYFTIEINGVKSLKDGKRFTQNSSKSLYTPLIIKFKDILQQYQELQLKYPELKNVFTNKDNEKQREILINDYNNIIKLSNYQNDVINSNLQIFKNELSSQFEKLNIGEQNQEENKVIDNQEEQKINDNQEQKINDLLQLKNSRGRKKDNLPPYEICGVYFTELPQYCRYHPVEYKEDGSIKKNERFQISQHKNLLKPWYSVKLETQILTTKQKFDQMIAKLKELNDQDIMI